jgi:molecular chaperone IbpA
MVSKQFLPFDLNNITPYAIGFDRIFDQMAQYADHQITSSGFPPYNIRKVDDYFFSIDLAVAGFSEDDIEIEVAEGVITVRSVKEDDETNEEYDSKIYRGISHRKFTRKFTVADDIIVNGASMINGMLSIDLERIVAEEKKPRLVKINNKS